MRATARQSSDPDQPSKSVIAATRAPIPTDGESVSVEWIADALARSGFHVRARLASVRSEAIGTGNGVFGQLTRLRLTYALRVPTDPASLILKTPSLSPPNRSRADAFDMYAREAAFYRDLAPRLRLRVPRCYVHEFDATTGRSVLLLEDLGHLHVGDQVTGLGPERASQAASAIAGAHAQLWDGKSLGALGWVPSLDGSVMRQLAATYRRQWPDFVGRYGRHLPAGALELGKRVGGCIDSVIRGLSRSPVTLVHGDYRADNLSLDRSNNRGAQLARSQALRTFRAALEIRASEVLGTDSAAP